MVKFISEFRSGDAAKRLVDRICSLPLHQQKITLMEVCGSHTMAIHKYGIRSLLPEQVKLISGPGCPVCVTTMSYIDYAIALSELNGVIITTFGDMMKVPGSNSNLMEKSSQGADIRVVYSPLESIDIARENPLSEVVFLAIGFETTSPTVAAVLKRAAEEQIKNFSVLVSHKLIPPAMRALASDPDVGVNGYLCPAHVSAIIGTRVYEFLPEENKVACVVAGFEPLDILQGIYQLLKQIVEKRYRVENEYSRVVKSNGNVHAKRLLAQVFEVTDDSWRGLGLITGSGYRLKEDWRKFDVRIRFDLDVPPAEEPEGCICGDILKGIKDPSNCPLFGSRCTPLTPVGACMVSSEGTCAAWYKYR